MTDGTELPESGGEGETPEEDPREVGETKEETHKASDIAMRDEQATSDPEALLAREGDHKQAEAIEKGFKEVVEGASTRSMKDTDPAVIIDSNEGSSNGAVPNREFDDIWQRFNSSVSQRDSGPDSGGKDEISNEQVRKPDIDPSVKIEPETERRPNKEREGPEVEATADAGRRVPVGADQAGLPRFSKDTAFSLSDEPGEQPGIKKPTFGDLVTSTLPWPLHKDLPYVNTDSRSESLANKLACALIVLLWNGLSDNEQEISEEGTVNRADVPAKSLTLEDLVSSVLPVPFHKDLPTTGESEEGIPPDPLQVYVEIQNLIALLADFDSSDREQTTHLLGKLEGLVDLIDDMDLSDEAREGFLDLINELIAQLAIWPLGETPAIIHDTPEELPGGSFNTGEGTDTMTEEQARHIEGERENSNGMLSEIKDRLKGSGDDENPDDGRDNND